MTARIHPDPGIVPYVITGSLTAIGGGLAAMAVTELSFVGGMVFGGVFYAVTLIVGACLGYYLDLCARNDSCLMRIATLVLWPFAVLSLLAPNASAAAVTTYVGFPVTFTASFGLALTTLAISLIFIAPYMACLGLRLYG